MIGRSSIGGFICHRCRLRQKVAFAPFQTPRLHSSAAAPLEYAIRRSDEPATKNENSQIDEHAGYSKIVKGLQIKRERLRAKTALLGGTSLGQPTQVLVLDDSYPHTPELQSLENSAAPQEEERQSESAFSLEERSGVLGQDEINEQIEALRPEESDHEKISYIQDDEFNALFEQLRDGFTGPQLQRYIDHLERSKEARRKVATQKLDEPDPSDGQRLQPTTWQAGKTSIKMRLVDFRLNRSERYTQQIHTQKVLVIFRIIKNYWNLGTIEDVSAEGELEVKLDKWKLDLLRMDKSNGLEGIGRKHHVLLDIYWPDSILRISGPRVSAEATMKDIERFLKTCKASVLDFSPFRKPLKKRQNPRSLFSEGDLDFVAQTTSTLILPEESDKVIIRATKEKDVNNARSSLLEIIHPRLHDSHETVTIETSEAPRLTPAGAVESTLKYKDRGQLYRRWTSPQTLIEAPECTKSRMSTEVTKTSEVERNIKVEERVKVESKTGAEGGDDAIESPRRSPVKEMLIKHHISRSLLSDVTMAKIEHFLVKDANVAPITFRDDSYWGDVKSHTSSSLGQVLYVQEKLSTGKSASQEAETKTNSVFSYAIPGMDKTIKLLDGDMAGVKIYENDNLDFRYIPSPWSKLGYEEASRYPPINIRLCKLPAPEGGVAYLFDAFFATLGEGRLDLQLPNKSADITFRTARRSWVKNPLSSWQDARLEQFIKDLENIVRHSRSIRGPPEFVFKVPKVFAHYSESSAGTKQTQLDGTDEVEVEYIFADVQHRETITRKDHKIASFMSVKGSALGGQHTTLMRRYTGGDRRAFISSIVDLADLATAAAATGTLPEPQRISEQTSPMTTSKSTSSDREHQHRHRHQHQLQPPKRRGMLRWQTGKDLGAEHAFPRASPSARAAGEATETFPRRGFFAKIQREGKGAVGAGPKGWAAQAARTPREELARATVDK